MAFRFLLAGESCVVVEFGDEINLELNRMVRYMFLSLKQMSIPGITELIPTYRSLYVEYNPLLIGLEELKKRLREVDEGTDEVDISPPRVVEIPTVYGGEHGPDLEFVANYNNLTQKEVVEIHTSQDYLVYMLGFTPGFAYLGGVSERIATPRLETPRLKVLAGTVAIAGQQTGVYPVDSPGGWRLLGKTPIQLFDPDRDPPALLQPTSDYVRFVSIDEDEYQTIKEQVEAGQYQVRTRNNLRKMD